MPEHDLQHALFRRVISGSTLREVVLKASEGGEWEEPKEGRKSWRRKKPGGGYEYRATKPGSKASGSEGSDKYTIGSKDEATLSRLIQQREKIVDRLKDQLRSSDEYRQRGDHEWAEEWVSVKVKHAHHYPRESTSKDQWQKDAALALAHNRIAMWKVADKKDRRIMLEGMKFIIGEDYGDAFDEIHNTMADYPAELIAGWEMYGTRVRLIQGRASYSPDSNAVFMDPDQLHGGSVLHHEMGHVLDDWFGEGKKCTGAASWEKEKIERLYSPEVATRIFEAGQAVAEVGEKLKDEGGWELTGSKEEPFWRGNWIDSYDARQYFGAEGLLEMISQNAERYKAHQEIPKIRAVVLHQLRARGADAGKLGEINDLFDGKTDSSDPAAARLFRRDPSLHLALHAGILTTHERDAFFQKVGRDLGYEGRWVVLLAKAAEWRQVESAYGPHMVELMKTIYGDEPKRSE